LRTQAADVLMQQVKMLFTDGAAIEAQFAIDRKSDDVSLQLSLAARPDSSLAGALNALSATDSLFGSFKGGNAGQVIIHAALPAACARSWGRPSMTWSRTRSTRKRTRTRRPSPRSC